MLDRSVDAGFQDYYVAMDVGGTSIKTGLLDALGNLTPYGCSQHPAQSDRSCSEILVNLLNLFRSAASPLVPGQHRILGWGLAFPGPFDYENGVSLIQGIGKYESLYRMNLREALWEKLKAEPDLRSLLSDSFSIRFDNDASLFALGESLRGKAAGHHKVLCVCLGTGTGSAFLEAGQLVTDRSDVPPQGWIYPLPFRDGMVDEHLSARGLLRLSEAQATLKGIADGCALAQLAQTGNPQALEVFQTFGEHLVQALEPHLKSFQPDALVLGGQISHSFPLFSPPLRTRLSQIMPNLVLEVSEDSAKSTLMGVYGLFSVRPHPQRPVLYDRYPEIQVKGWEGSAAQGWPDIVEALLDFRQGRHKTVIVVDFYPGIRAEEVISGLSGLDACLTIHSDDCSLSSSAITERMSSNLTEDRVFGILTTDKLEDYFDHALIQAAREKITAHPEGIVLVYGVGARLITLGDCLVYADLARWEIQQRYRKGMPNWRQDNGEAHILEKYKRGYFVEWRLADRHKKALLEHVDFLLDTNTPHDPKLVTGPAFRDALKQAARRPFRVVPYFDPGVWGGQWMKEVCGLDKSAPNYAWSFDGVPEENSLYLRFGKVRIEVPSLDLVLYQPDALLGARVHARFGTEFPIRFDFLDTIQGQNLSLQVHPLTEYIQETFGMHYTQEESYYILDTDPSFQPCVYLGLKESIDREAMLRDLRSAENGGTPFPDEKYINKIPARKHDHFLIPAGTVHCSGAGTMVLEISATPYIFTFKLWDWNRVGLDGLPRPLHIDHGAQVIQWNRTTGWVHQNLVNQITLVGQGDGWREEKTGLHDLEFIETRRHWFTKPVLHTTGSGVNVLNLIEGVEAVVESPDGSFEPFVVHYAETFIVPAAVGSYVIRPAVRNQGREMATIKAFVR